MRERERDDGWMDGEGGGGQREGGRGMDGGKEAERERRAGSCQQYATAHVNKEEDAPRARFH